MVSLLLVLTVPPAAADERIERRLAAMGTTLTVTVQAPDRATALSASEAAVRAVAAAEARLSTWRPDSELSALNQAPLDSWVELSPALASDLATARWCHDETAGAFDPAIGALVDTWGLREGGRVPGDAELAHALEVSGLDQFELDGRRALRRAPVHFDAGGFGKGIALDEGLAAARRAGASAVLLDLGGQLAVHGMSMWVGIADPGRRDQVIDGVELTHGSVATSGHSERPGHLLDPRSGRPAPDFGSVTVWASSAAQADCLSTGLMVLGPDASRRWADSHPDHRVVLTLHPGETP